MGQFRYGTQQASCPLQLAIRLMGGKWKALILYHIGQGLDRFGALQRRIDGISTRMLAQELNALQDIGMVEKTVYAEVPPRTAYRLTPEGEAMKTALEPLRQWGMAYRQPAPD